MSCKIVLAGFYYGGVPPPGTTNGSGTSPSALSAMSSWSSASGYPPGLISQLAGPGWRSNSCSLSNNNLQYEVCLSGLFVGNGGLHGLGGSIPGLPSGFSGLPHGLNGSLAPSPTSREDTPHSMSPKPSSDLVRPVFFISLPTYDHWVELWFIRIDGQRPAATTPTTTTKTGHSFDVVGQASLQNNSTSWKKNSKKAIIRIWKLERNYLKKLPCQRLGFR